MFNDQMLTMLNEKWENNLLFLLLEHITINIVQGVDYTTRVSATVST